MTDNIKKAAEKLYPCEISYPFSVKTGQLHLRTAFYNGATSEAAREYWEQESWMTGFPEKTGYYTVYDTNCIPGWEIKTARFDSYNNQWFELSGDAIHPSQWRPLPKPPKTV